MSEIQTDIVQVGKEFYVNERDRFYANWIEAFWREMFQNSCDAGARNIRISLAERPRRGSFFRVIEDDRDIVRVLFDDDGCGMSKDVLENVFFRPGNTTKTGSGSVGGFGRARLMSHLSNHRYGIYTGNSVVEGDGPEKKHETASKFLELWQRRREGLLSERSSELTENGDGPRSERLLRMIEELDETIALVEEQVGRPRAGCRMEIDLDPFARSQQWNSRSPTIEAMRESLAAYLKMSNVPATVTIDGVRSEDRLSLRSMARKDLSTDVDGSPETFARAYYTMSKNAPYRRQMIVRVDGATMFTTHVDSDVQIVLEIDKARSREILTSNRDGFQSTFRQAVDAFVQSVVVDTRSALDDRKDSFEFLEGEQGHRTASRPEPKASLEHVDMERVRELTERAPPAPVARPALSELEENGIDGISLHTIHRFFREIQNDPYESFLSALDGGLDAARAVRDAMDSGDSNGRRVEAVLKCLDPRFLSLSLAVIRDRQVRAAEEAARKASERLGHGMGDVATHLKGNVSGSLRDAYTRNHPRRWNPETGAGRKPRQIYEAWTICCELALESLYARHPEMAPEHFDWSTGFVYAAPEEKYDLERWRTAFMIDAEYVERGPDVRTNTFFLNPVDSEGRLKYAVASTRDLQKMAVLACHEVAHVGVKTHNEDFANLMQSVVQHFDFAEMNTRVSRMRKEIARLYAKPKLAAQAMDDQPGSRPVDRLMAGLAPRTTMSSALSDDVHPSDTLRTLASFGRTSGGDGVTIYDTEAMTLAETALREGMRRNVANDLDDEPVLEVEDDTPRFGRG